MSNGSNKHWGLQFCESSSAASFWRTAFKRSSFTDFMELPERSLEWGSPHRP